MAPSASTGPACGRGCSADRTKRNILGANHQHSERGGGDPVDGRGFRHSGVLPARRSLSAIPAPGRHPLPEPEMELRTRSFRPDARRRRHRRPLEAQARHQRPAGRGATGRARQARTCGQFLDRSRRPKHRIGNRRRTLQGQAAEGARRGDRRDSPSLGPSGVQIHGAGGGGRVSASALPARLPVWFDVPPLPTARTVRCSSVSGFLWNEPHVRSGPLRADPDGLHLQLPGPGRQSDRHGPWRFPAPSCWRTMRATRLRKSGPWSRAPFQA